MISLAMVDFKSYAESTFEALDAVGAADFLARQRKILIKPNLINASPPPVTTPVALCEAIVRYIRECSPAEIVIGEGCGDPSLETDAVFSSLGYAALAKQYDLTLVDLNAGPLARRMNPGGTVFTEMHLPEIVFSHCLVSAPVLKAHSLADITGTLKNMIGIAPPSHYGGRGGTWKKAAFHRRMQASIVDLNRCRIPDLSVMDARIGLADYHLGGPCCDPPAGKILAGFDPYAVDREAARLLGMDWRRIPHLRNNR